MSSGIKYRSLSVEMSHSYSIAECNNDIASAPPSYDSCREILDTMPWSTNSVTFGFPWQVQQSFPKFALVPHNGNPDRR